jgi:hypothetical protein
VGGTNGARKRAAASISSRPGSEVALEMRWVAAAVFMPKI